MLTHDLTIPDFNNITHQEAWTFIVALLLLLMLLAICKRAFNWLRQPRRVGMSDPRREKYVNTRLADVITNGLENEVHEGRLSRKEVQSAYAEFARRMKMPDLLPRPLRMNGKNSQELKGRIRSRVPEADKKLKAMRDQLPAQTWATRLFGGAIRQS